MKNLESAKPSKVETLQHIDVAPRPFLGRDLTREPQLSDPKVKGFTYCGPSNKRFYAPVEPTERTDIVVYKDLMDQCAQEFPLSHCAPHIEELNMVRFTEAIKPNKFKYTPWQKSWDDYLKLAFRNVEPTRCLSFDEALQTFTDDGLLEKSAGYPFNERCVCGQPHKYKGGVISCPSAVECLRKCFNEVSEGKNPDFPLVLDTFCKDERQKKAKVDEDRTRLVNTNTMLSELLLRAEFYVGIRNMSKQAEHIPIKIGMNIHDGGLHRMFDRVAAKFFTLELDAENLDSTEDEDLMDHSFRSMETVLGAPTTEQSKNRRDFGRQSISGLKAFNINGKILRLLVAFLNSSGHFLTGDINSFAMLFNLFVMYFEQPPSLRQVVDYVSNCEINVYGDDVLAGWDKQRTEEYIENSSARLGLRTPAAKMRARPRTVSTTVARLDTAMVSGSSFLGQIGEFVEGHWAFKPSRPAKVLVNFMRPVGNTTLSGAGEQNVVLSLLANFCYDDELKIVVNGITLSVFDLVYKQYCQKYPTIILPTRRVFKAARSGEESGGLCTLKRAEPTPFEDSEREFPIFLPDLTPVVDGLLESGKAPATLPSTPVEKPVVWSTVPIKIIPITSPPEPFLDTKSKDPPKDFKVVHHARSAPQVKGVAPTQTFSDDALSALEAIRKVPKEKRQAFMKNYIRRLKKKKAVQDNPRNVRDDSNNGVK